jgi:long-subunit fatty acid transport protein
VARPDDLTALFHNPAGLADQRGLRFHASGLLFASATSIRMQALDPLRFPAINPEGCGGEATPTCPWPVGADGTYADPIETGLVVGGAPYLAASSDLGGAHPRLKNLVVSAALYLPDLIAGTSDPDTPAAYHVIDSAFLAVAAGLGAGLRVTDRVAVGIALSYHHLRLSQSRKLSPTDLLTPAGAEPDALARLAQEAVGDLRIDYDGVDHGLGWTAGLLVDPLPWLSVGLSYSGATAATFEGPVTLAAPALDDPAALEGALRGLGYKVPRGLSVDQPIPHALFFGVNIRPHRWLELGVDYRVWLYSLFTEQRIAPRYDSDDPGREEPLTSEQLSRRLDYTLSHQISLGALVRPLAARPALELLLGVILDTSPVPDETFRLDSPSLDMVVPTLGLRWSGDRWRLWAGYLLSVYLERDIRASQTRPPTNVAIGGLRHNLSLGAEVRY